MNDTTILCDIYKAHYGDTYLVYIQASGLDLFEQEKISIFPSIVAYSGKTQRGAKAWYFKRQDLAKLIADEDFSFTFRTWSKKKDDPQKKLM